MGFKRLTGSAGLCLALLSMSLPSQADSAGRAAEGATPTELEGSPATLPASAPSEVASGQDAELERARQIFDFAKALFAAGDYNAALAEFTRAHETLDGHPRQYFLLHNIASCHERMHRYDLALDFYEEYLRRAPETEPDLGEVKGVVRALRSLLATLHIDSNVRAEIWVDDRHVGAAPGRVLVPAGRHTLEVRADLHESNRREIQLAAGQSQRILFDLRPLSTFKGPHRAYFWSSIAIGGTALAAGGIFGVLALSAKQEGEDKAALHFDSRQESERARKLSTAADACFGAAAAFAATSAVLFFVTDWSSGHPSSTASRGDWPAPSLDLSVGVAAGVNAQVRGHF